MLSISSSVAVFFVAAVLAGTGDLGMWRSTKSHVATSILSEITDRIEPAFAFAFVFTFAFGGIARSLDSLPLRMPYTSASLTKTQVQGLVGSLVCVVSSTNKHAPTGRGYAHVHDPS